MQQYDFPLNFVFKITTFSNDFTVKDAKGLTVCYVKQKLFKLVEEVVVYKDETQSELLYAINANKWIDFSATYVFSDSFNADLGRVGRKGWSSLWKAHYEIYDQQQEKDFDIREENAWVRVGDLVLGQIPVVGLLTGYFFNPAYEVSRPDGTAVARLKKEKSFFGRRFSLERLNTFEGDEEARIILSLMMMILLERRRG
jgi:uncharacterized protein YxjI